MIGVDSRTVPDRMLGCWVREYIRYRDGTEDRSTRVIWLQTLSGMVDIRLPARDKSIVEKKSFDDYDIEDLIELAKQDCGTGITTLDETTVPYATASWDSDDDDIYIHTISYFPEDGWFQWQDDGRCMMEWAPSGAYEEDWRLQTNSLGITAQFKKLDTDVKCMLFLAGDHAVYVKDRDFKLTEERPLQEIAADHRDDREYILSLLACDFSHAVLDRSASKYIIDASTYPFLEGEELKIEEFKKANPARGNIFDTDNNEKWIITSWYES